MFAFGVDANHEKGRNVHRVVQSFRNHIDPVPIQSPNIDTEREIHVDRQTDTHTHTQRMEETRSEVRFSEEQKITAVHSLP